jgi:hypothetical protein
VPPGGLEDLDSAVESRGAAAQIAGSRLRARPKAEVGDSLERSGKHDGMLVLRFESEQRSA